MGLDSQFWYNQPVVRDPDSDSRSRGGRFVDFRAEAIGKEPYAPPQGMEWTVIDLKDDQQRTEVYDLLRFNYVEDDEGCFRFEYSQPFLQWALTKPGYQPDWFVGLRRDCVLVAFITALPTTLSLWKTTVTAVEVNFLCVSKEERSTGLAPLLIKEVTRRANLQGVQQAIYTCGKKITTPLSVARYWHRTLSPQKLVETGFDYLPTGVSMEQLIQKYDLPSSTSANFLPMQKSFIRSACRLLNKFLSLYSVHPIFDEAEFEHKFTTKEGIVTTMVKIVDGEVTDMFSFYTVTTAVLGHPLHKQIHGAYSYYNVATTMTETDLMREAITCAKRLGHDVFNAVDVMNNHQCFDSLMFGKGDGWLHYYLFNWKFQPESSRLMGTVLV